MSALRSLPNPSANGTIPADGGGEFAGALFDADEFLGTAHIPPQHPETELVCYVEGCSVELVVHRNADQLGGGRRNVVMGFSRQSRSRLIRFMGSINQKEYKPKQIAFISLTYHEKWPDDPEGWKAQLESFRKRLERRYEELPGVWKLEFQERGAPHFHLILFLPLDLVHKPSAVSSFKRYVYETWNDIAGYGSTDHMTYGADVRFKESWRGVMSYTSKYMSKEQLVAVRLEDGRVMRTGRCWSYWRKNLLPIEEKRVSISWDDYLKLRRWFRRLRRRPQRRWLDRPYRWDKIGMTVLLSWSELQKLLEWLGYYTDIPPPTSPGGPAHPALAGAGPPRAVVGVCPRRPIPSSGEGGDLE